MTTTNSLIIREFTLKDTHAIFELSQEEGIKQWIPDQVYHNEETAEETLQYLIKQYTQPIDPSKRPYVLCIEEKISHKVIGHIGASSIERGVEIGYAIGNNHQNKGYATEAIIAFCNWLFTELKLPEVYGIVASENVASIKALEKAGFKLEKEQQQMMHEQLRMVRTYIFQV